MLNARIRLTFAVAAAVSSFAMLGGCSKDQAANGHGDGIPSDAKIEAEKPAKPNAAVHVAAADLALDQNKPAEAIQQYEAALAEVPTDADALFKLATVQTYGRAFDKAIPLWQRYTSATHDSANGWSNLGRCQELAGSWRDAEVAYLEALKREPTLKAARVNYGILLAKRERYDEAEQQLGKVLVPAEVQYDIGSACEMRHDTVTARQRYERALSFDPGLVAARQRLEALRAEASAAS